MRHFNITFAFVIVVCAIILKLFLIAPRDIGGHLEAWDQLWYIISANTWYWGRSYDQLTLVRPPIYPIFIAANNLLGVPLRLTIELLYIASAASFALALGRLGLPAFAGAAGFAFAVLHPYSLPLFDNALAETLYSCLLLLLFGEFVRMCAPVSATEHIVRVVTFSLLLAVLWFTRPEWPLLAAFLGLIGFVVVINFARGTLTLRQSVRWLGSGIGAPALAVVLLGLSIATANYARYGVFILTELNAPNFMRAYNALQAIDAGEPVRFVPVSKKSIELAYPYSSALQELRPHINGELWDRVAKGSKIEMGPGFPDGEIGAGWFYWMFREFVAMAGQHRNARQADAFYARLADEIELALAEGRLPKRSLILPFVDPNIGLWFRHLPHSLVNVARLLIPLQPATTVQQTPNLPPEFEALFDRVANRRVETAASFKQDPKATYAALDRTIELTREIYFPALAILVVAALVRIGICIGSRGSPTQRLVLAPGVHLAILGACIGMIAGRVFLFGVLDASAWSGTSIRYLFPAIPLVPFMIILFAGSVRREATQECESRAVHQAVS